MVNRIVQGTKTFFDLGPWAWRVLIALAVLSWGGPVAMKLVRGDVRPVNTDVLGYVSTRGPWAGSLLPDGTWSHPEGVPDYVFSPGQSVVWESMTNVVPGSTVSAEFTLWCGGKPIYTADVHIYSTQRRSGWGKNGLHIPTGTPPGDCGIRRHADALGPNGEHQVKDDYPVINVRIQAP